MIIVLVENYPSLGGEVGPPPKKKIIIIKLDVYDECVEIKTTNSYKIKYCCTFWVLGQLPTGDHSPLDKNKVQLLLTRTTIPRTIPHEDNSSPGPLLTRTTTNQSNHSSGPIHVRWGIVLVGSVRTGSF